MEISGKIPPLEATAYIKKSPEIVEKSSVSGPGADRVALSDRARELQAAHAAVKQMDDVDHEKVARIKAQIQAGTYAVDARKIAGKMLEDALLGDLE